MADDELEEERLTHSTEANDSGPFQSYFYVVPSQPVRIHTACETDGKTIMKITIILSDLQSKLSNYLSSIRLNSGIVTRSVTRSHD